MEKLDFVRVLWFIFEISVDMWLFESNVGFWLVIWYVMSMFSILFKSFMVVFVMLWVWKNVKYYGKKFLLWLVYGIVCVIFKEFFLVYYWE